jgi:hypothetical protein
MVRTYHQQQVRLLGVMGWVEDKPLNQNVLGMLGWHHGTDGGKLRAGKSIWQVPPRRMALWISCYLQDKVGGEFLSQVRKEWFPQGA